MTKPVDPYGIKNVNFSLIKEDDGRFEAYKKQRLERGFDDSELWSLDCTIAEFIAPRLKAYKEAAAKIGDHPFDITSEEWQNILGEMVEGFEIYPEHFHWVEEEAERNWKKVNKALSHFHKYFFTLWN